MMNDLNNLIWSGLFVNDLSMHDYSRDIMLATTQEKIQMKMLLAAAEKKADYLNTQQKKLGDIMKKSDDLISQMLPKKVADDLAKGKSNVEVIINIIIVLVIIVKIIVLVAVVVIVVVIVVVMDVFLVVIVIVVFVIVVVVPFLLIYIITVYTFFMTII